VLLPGPADTGRHSAPRCTLPVRHDSPLQLRSPRHRRAPEQVGIPHGTPNVPLTGFDLCPSLRKMMLATLNPYQLYSRSGGPAIYYCVLLLHKTKSPGFIGPVLLILETETATASMHQACGPHHYTTTPSATFFMTLLPCTSPAMPTSSIEIILTTIQPGNSVREATRIALRNALPLLLPECLYSGRLRLDASNRERPARSRNGSVHRRTRTPWMFLS